MIIIFVSILGLVTGSFLNVCIYRIPRGESIIFPPSHCTNCGNKLGPLDLIPVVSFLLLRGRCRYCREAIGIRYPLIELVTSLLFLMSYSHFGISIQLLQALILVSLMVIVFEVDREHFLIPNKVILAALIFAFLINVFFELPGWKEFILGGLAGGLPLLILALIRPDGMGMGDVKLSAVLGMFLGWKEVLMVIFLSALLTSIIGVFLILSGIKKRNEPIPFGPFMAFAALVVLFWGGQLLEWYLITFIL